MANHFTNSNSESFIETLLNEGWEAASPGKRRKFARDALKLDLNCVDAYVLLALEAPSLAERIALLSEGVAAGDRNWSALVMPENTSWLGLMETRPYMRAMHNLGLALEEAERPDESEVIYKRLLSMNPTDNQGVRYLLLRMWTAHNRLEECSKLLKEYPDDCYLDAMMTALQIALSNEKYLSVKQHFAVIEDRNIHILRLLQTAIKTNRWPKSNNHNLIMGSKNEANAYLVNYKNGWLENDSVRELFLRLYVEFKN